MISLIFLRLNPEVVSKDTIPDNNKYSVLVIDDNSINLQVAHGLLKLYGLHIDLATSGKKALDLAEKNYYNLIFLDYMMPAMDGIETLKQIRKLPSKYCKTVPVIALTANAVSGAEKMFLSSGFSDYLSKPMQLNNVSTILNKWLSIHINPTLKDVTDSVKDKRPEFFNLFLRYSIDWVYGVANSNGSWNSYFDLLELFSHDGLHQKEELTTAFRDNDLNLYCVLVHAMKSSLITIGVKGLAEQALSLELASKEGNLDFIKSRHTEFTNKFMVLCYAIIGFLNSEINS